MNVRFTTEAQQHIAAIYDYIYLRNSVAAIAVTARIRAAADLLKDFPLLGHKSVVAGTHELVVKGLPYILVYEVRKRNREVVVLGVFHGARDFKGNGSH
ncbi:MAG TPA: type II toxin-antitoxin system RelE/ParE family toxin [Candidatus Paceibacterota bacterium]